MFNVVNQYGNNSYPTVYDQNPGLSLGSGDDFLSPRGISNISSGFSSSISPTTSGSPYIWGNGSPYSHNANAMEILLRTTDYSSDITPPSSNRPTNLVRLPELPYPYFQAVPDLGTNPNAMMVLSATTQFQGDLRTEGVAAIPGYPVINFGQNPSAMDIMGGSNAFISSTIPYHPTMSTGNGAFYPGANGGGFYYPPPAIQPPYYHRPGHPYFPCPFPPFPPYYPPYPYPQHQPTTLELANMIDSNVKELPGFIPSNVPAEVADFINEFNNLPEGERIKLRQKYSNPTRVDMDILNSSGITSTGGKYKQGKVVNPFLKAGFLTDTNPFATYETGMVVTNGNGNGKVLGTVERDIILGTKNRSNIINGNGGEDDIITSSKADMVNVSQGDRVATDSGDDLLFFDFSSPDLESVRQTVVDGGSGNDVMVLTVKGNPSREASLPTFRQLSNGFLSVSLNGIQFLARNIEKFIIVDQQGNIGSVYKSTKK